MDHAIRMKGQKNEFREVCIVFVNSLPRDPCIIPRYNAQVQRDCNLVAIAKR